MDRTKIEEALVEFRKGVGKSEQLDNPAKSIVRTMGEEDDILSSHFKTLYAINIVEAIEASKSKEGK